MKGAYRKLAMQCHPDRNPGDKDCEHKFKEINEAYDVLKDGRSAPPMTASATPPSSRAAAGGAHGFGADFGSAFSDIFEDIFGMGGARQRHASRPRARRGSALQHGDHARGGLRRQDRADARCRPRSPARPAPAPAPSPAPSRRPASLRRPRQGAPRAGLLHPRAHLPDLPGPRPGDRGPVPDLPRLGPRHARAHAVGQHPAGRRGRHPHPPRRRGRSRRARRAAGRPLHFPVARSRTSSSSATAPTCIAACRSRW